MMRLGFEKRADLRQGRDCRRGGRAAALSCGRGVGTTKSPTGAQKCAAGPPWRDLSGPSRAGSVRIPILQHVSAWVKKVMDSAAIASHAGGKTGYVGRYWFPVR